jgi:hypothetical protein
MFSRVDGCLLTPGQEPFREMVPLAAWWEGQAEHSRIRSGLEDTSGERAAGELLLVCLVFLSDFLSQKWQAESRRIKEGSGVPATLAGAS